jgi:nicotinamide mononucleotide transporter
METYIEYAAVLLGVVYVLLASKGDIWCWVFGILSSALYISINVTHHLYQDAILQFYYVAAGFYGWWNWYPTPTLPEGEGFKSMRIQSLSLQQNLQLFSFGALLVPVLGYFFSKLGNSLSYFDSAVTIFSFIATWMTARKLLENWLYWIVIDLVAAVMYGIKGLYPTAALYVFFAVVAVYGYLEWKKQMNLQNT